MSMDFALVLAEEFNIRKSQVENTIKLIDDGNTIPFIARYRKEVTGSLDDQTLRMLDERLEYLRNFEKRKEDIKKSIENQEKLTDEIVSALDGAKTLAELEDIYRPFKQKRKTRATKAVERGLKPLADYIFEQGENCESPVIVAKEYINPELEVNTVEDAIAGAEDIIAEAISDNAEIRKSLRELYVRFGIISSKETAKAKESESVYTMYYDYSEAVNKIAGHRVLALDRGEREEFLKVTVEVDKDKTDAVLMEVLKPNTPCSKYVWDAASDAFDRLIHPSLEREIRNMLTDTADENAIKVFSENLCHLLMQPPVKGKVALGLDPGYRTGCKVAVVDATGRVLDTDVIYPVPPHKRIEEANTKIASKVRKYGVSIIAIGNGTASKETEIFAANLIKDQHLDVSYMVVSEAGASVYSASKLAAEEFPQFDVSLRSAVSIARRLQDPLAELVKIDPKAIGVGQYQHDMPKQRMDEALGGVVENCVNTVGVDLNTASPSLLARVAGINGTVAKNIVTFREENGAFNSRTQLKKVSKLGPKAFEQCAGFLRIVESKNILDNTGVHPESYAAANKLLELCDYTKKDVECGYLSDLLEKAKQIGMANLAQQCDVGEITLKDIIGELQKPGRDPRDELPKPLLRTDIMEMKDLKPGMEITGTVRNVVDFGAFVDIGVHQDGLVHISQITDKYIKHPSEVLKVGDIVTAKILSLDVEKKRIALTLR